MYTLLALKQLSLTCHVWFRRKQIFEKAVMVRREVTLHQKRGRYSRVQRWFLVLGGKRHFVPYAPGGTRLFDHIEH